MSSMIRKLVPLALMVISNFGYAMGVDKVAIQLDTSRGFKGVGSITIFNEEVDQPVFVTAKPLKWEMSKDGQSHLEPTQDLTIYPSVQRVRPGENAAFKVRYNGAPIKQEGNYRILFTQVKLPVGKSMPDGQLNKTSEEVDQGLLVSLALTVPVYVDDFSIKSDLKSQVKATFLKKDGKITLDVINNGPEHITIKKSRFDGVDGSPLGVVLAKSERQFVIDGKDPKKVELDLVARDASETIQALGGTQ
ncbi:hypothetical protein ACS0Y3_16865 [Burkholderia gladioli]|uniref:hypothetical protein n=1 Tax=Burkholderia gladioli TaxID=28095 RepID=UPI003F798A25